MQINRNDTGVVFIDPQNEVLSEKGAAWAAVRESIKENKTVENIERIFQAGKQHGFEVFISPHYFYPTDKGWKFNGPLETSEHENKMFARRGVLSLDGFLGWVRKPAISHCSCASAASVKSSSVGCWRTCA
jgi:nicotinamidase-related amidase